MPTATTYKLSEREVPMWFFDTFSELEAFAELTPESYVARVREELFPDVTGFFHDGYPTTDSNTIAAFRVKESWFNAS